MKVNGSCHCGSIKFDADVDESAVIVCHCTDCQTLSGSPFRVTAAAPIGSFILSGGPPQTYRKVAESGATRMQTFCGVCGTPMYSAAESNPTHIFIRIGTIRQRELLRPSVQIWHRSALHCFEDLSAIASSSEEQALKFK